MLRRFLAAICSILVFSLSGCFEIRTAEPGDKNIKVFGNGYVITKNDLTVYYTDDITIEEINSLSCILYEKKIKLEKVDGKYNVYFIILKDEIEKLTGGNEDKEFDEFFEIEARSISDLVFNHSPVVVNVCDSSFKVVKSYQYDPTEPIKTNISIPKLNYQNLSIDGCVIYYTNNVSKDDANALARYLHFINYFDGDVYAIKIDKSSSGEYMLDIIISSFILSDEHLSDNYLSGADDISFSVFNNEKVVINLCDYNFKPVKSRESS